MESQFAIRAATENDAPGIGEVHVRSWQSTYVGIIGETYLQSLSVEKRTQLVVGFADVGASREKKLEGKGELYAIYLAPAAQGQGIDRELFAVALTAIRQLGFTEFFVSALSANAGALGFYLRMGGRLIGHDHVDIDGQRHITDTLSWNLNAARRD